jgi:ABC-type sulfate/molybdate transport systems ATPase subunit
VLDVACELPRREFTIRAAFSVRPGERLALFGPSGSGKTSILETIAGLVRPRRGQVVLNGRTLTRADRRTVVQVPPWTRRVGLLRQDPALFPHLTVQENIQYSQAAAEAGGAALWDVAERLEIAHLLNQRSRSVSGGQAHRVALARLLMADHDALLLDEPYTGLDARLRRVLTDVVREEARDRSVPSILVAHELVEAQAFADRVAILDAGQILQVGTPADVVRRPASRRVAELVGYLGFVPTSLIPAQTDTHGPPPGGVTIGVHPERTRPGSAPDRGVVLRGVTSDARPAGTGWEVDLSLWGGDQGVNLTCRVADDPPAPGSGFVVTVVDPPWFDSGGGLVPSVGREAVGWGPLAEP